MSQPITRDSAESGFSLMELLVAIGIMAAISAATVPLVIKFAAAGQSGAQKKEVTHVQNAIKSLMADASLVTIDANSGTAINTWTGLPTKNSGPIKADGVNTDMSEYMRMKNDQTTYYYCWNVEAQVSVHATAEACP